VGRADAAILEFSAKGATKRRQTARGRPFLNIFPEGEGVMGNAEEICFQAPAWSKDRQMFPMRQNLRAGWESRKAR
jgi:hypothetical protein